MQLRAAILLALTLALATACTAEDAPVAPSDAVAPTAPAPAASPLATPIPGAADIRPNASHPHPPAPARRRPLRRRPRPRQPR